MDWAERMNRAIGFVEAHLADEIDYGEAARIACCSVDHFQRMFPYLTGVSLSEYVRRRRLTLAAYELQNSKVKVIDLALRYGYESPEAFARAFQQLHGTTPTAARQPGTKLKAYPPITFQFTLRGAAEMNYRIERTEAFRVVGIQSRVHTDSAFQEVPAIFQNAKREGWFDKLWDMRAEDHPVRGILGVCADGDFGKNAYFHYILSIGTEQEAPAGMVSRAFPPAVWAVFEADHPDGIGDIWRRLYTEWLPTSGYDLAYLPSIECYLPPEENRNELWVAVEKRA